LSSNEFAIRPSIVSISGDACTEPDANNADASSEQASKHTADCT
jgi:hypothetical protein